MYSVPRISRLIYDNIPAAMILVIGIIAWQLTVDIFDIPEFLVPPPSRIVEQLFFSNINWLYHFWITTYETLAGFLVAAAFGIVSAYIIVHYKRINKVIYPYILLAQIVPKVAIAPLFFIWFGFGELPKILVAFLVAFFPIVIDTAVGLNAADPDMLDLMRSLGASKYEIFRKVKLPAALPHIFGGFKVAITLAVIGAVIGEFVGAEAGLGYVIMLAQNHFRTDVVFASLILLVVLGIMLFIIFEAIERIVTPWYAKMKRIR